ncbi:unnamed protein product [Camellia sinensis]
MQVVTYETKEMSGTGEKGSTTTKTPADFLKSIRGRPVVVKLNSGVDYRGHHLLIEYFLNNLVICGFPKGGVIPWRVGEVMKLVAVPFLACPCSPLSSLHYILICILACLDGYMNIAMEQTEEYVNGQLKNKYGDAFIRGNNGNTLHQYIKEDNGRRGLALTRKSPRLYFVDLGK